MSNKAIGIFDSGVGGLSVWKEVAKLLPYENIVYLADSKNCPYGTKPHDEILKLSIANTEFLLKNNCKIIIVACNTATAAAIETLREKYIVPFIGMEPAVKPAALNTNTGKIGVLATEGTFNGKLYKETSQKYTQNIEQIIQIGEGLVELVEQGKAESKEAIDIIKKNVQGFLKNEVDHIVLGCTHYPFLMNQLLQIIPANIKIVDPAPAIAKRTMQVLYERNLLCSAKEAKYSFYNSGSSEVMKQILKTFEVKANVLKTTHSND